VTSAVWLCSQGEAVASGRTIKGAAHMITRRTLSVAVFGAAMIAASCGSDGGGSSAPTSSVAATTGVTFEASTVPATTAAAVPQDIDQLEAAWAAQRDAIVQKIKTGGYGIDQATNTLKGPAGFSVDLNTCLKGWSNTEGLTDTTIKIGQALTQSGATADFGNQAKAWGAYIEYINEKFGGIPDSTGKTRKVSLITKDDGYDPARTIPLVDELLDSEKVFALTTSGSPSTLRTYDKLNQYCVPQAFVWTGHAAWGDPVHHPWTMGSILGYSTEAELWVEYISQTLPPDATVAALVMNNEFGHFYLDAFNASLAKRNSKLKVETEVFEATAPTVKDQMTTLASKHPAAFIMMGTGSVCAQAIIEAAENGLAASAQQLWQPSVCKPLSLVGKDAVGDASNGWLIVGGGQVDINDPAVAEQPAIVWAKKVLTDHGLDPKSSSNLGAGFYLGWPWIETLRIAAQLDGGLTRTNFLLAMRSLDLESPFLLPGIKITTNGNEDAYPIEGSEIAKFDSSKQSWVKIGETLDLSGKSGVCAWDQSVGKCAAS
jgi:branched-chain amino acid transport system substrate-binding protein